MKIAAIVTCWQSSMEDTLRIGRVVAGLRQQSVVAKTWIWANGSCVDHGMRDSGISSAPGVRLASSEENLGCSVALRLAGLLDAEFILKIDDDVEITDPDFVERGLAAMGDRYDIAGVMGRRLPGEEPYYRGRLSVLRPELDTEVDIAVGKLVLYRRKILARVPCLAEREEDLQLARASRTPAIIPGSWAEGWQDLPRASGQNMSDNPEHYQRRERYVKEHLHELRKLGQPVQRAPDLDRRL